MNIRAIIPAIVLAFALMGCSAPQIHSTGLGSVDLVTMTDQMSASLLRSPAIAARTSQSPEWIVTLDRAGNQTNQVIPRPQLRAFMARLRAQLAQNPALRERRLVFVISKQPGDAVSERELTTPAPRTTPTHALAATFYSITTESTRARSDAYLCSFQLIDAATGQILWEDKYEVKRAVMRNEFD